MADWQGLLDREAVQARQILKKLVEGRLIFDPFEDADGVGYNIRGGRRPMAACSPVSFRWCPRGDSNTRHAV